MDTLALKTAIQQELPAMFQNDPALRQFVLDLSAQYFASKSETQSNFDKVLGEIKAMRREQMRYQSEQNLKWEEQNRKWEEQNQRWEENQKTIHKMQESIDEGISEIQKLSKKHDSTIGALGARWGTQSESAFREALRSILEESFQVKVENVTLLDTEGVVFGQPDQIELDVIIKNGVLIICEIKSSMSKSDVYTFSRKIEFYEKLNDRKATRKIIISPMPDRYAVPTAEKLGIELFGYVDDVKNI